MEICYSEIYFELLKIGFSRVKLEVPKLGFVVQTD